LFYFLRVGEEDNGEEEGGRIRSVSETSNQVNDDDVAGSSISHGDVKSTEKVQNGDDVDGLVTDEGVDDDVDVDADAMNALLGKFANCKV
jgi:hypothetical protein